ncbi:16S rRNA (uracil(1498)-N(3))-methyltransferase [Ostreiculturibacter nitratireducens]|uniref:16S rRNA (uracil(1498)-N(3))-methyltransferase n=1 Tax=Ostreiculturibacter nitratireducens TaxID=3075226 RepID=UPI0031B6338B
MSDAKIRLHLDQPLGAGQSLPLAEAQAHYLFGVMRLGVGARVLVFNGRDGEWLAEVEEAGKRKGLLRCVELVRPQDSPPDLWLLFAPLKKARTDFVVEKAVELGAARIQPVQTEFTNAERVRQDRLQAHATEAAEQCGATWVPEVADLERLDRVLAGWPEGRRLYYCDEGEAGRASSLAALVENEGRASAEAILIGPEGGFSEAERTRLRALPFVTVLPLGPRILRAETAAVAALALWQAARGDWR